MIHFFLLSILVSLPASVAYVAHSLSGFFYADDWVYLGMVAERSLARPHEFLSLQVPFFWRPLGDYLFALQYTLFALNPLPYQCVSLMLHLIVLGMFGVFVGAVTRSLPVAVGAAFLASSSWTMADSVSWISNQSGLVAAAAGWGMLAVWWALAETEERRTRLIAVVAGCYLIALLSKQSSLAYLPAIAVLSVWRILGMESGRLREARRHAIAALPVILLTLVYLSIHTFVTPGRQAHVTLDYTLDPIWKWPLNFLQSLTHTVLSPLGGVHSALLWNNTPLIAGIGLVALAVVWLASAKPPQRGERWLFLLFPVLFLPALLLASFHSARYYYTPGMVFSLVMVLLLGRLTGKGRMGLGAAVATGLLVYTGNVHHLWRVTRADAALTLPTRVLFESIARESTDHVKPATYLIVPADGIEVMGIIDLVRLATGDHRTEGLFTTTRFEADYLRRLHDLSPVVYLVSPTGNSEAPWSITARRAENTLPPRPE